MTELLAPEFLNLPTPTPKQTADSFLKQALRLSMLRMMGTLYAGRPSTTTRAKILLIRPDHLGDLLFLTPTLRYLRSLLPQAEISLMVGPWGEAVYRHNPHVNEVLVCEFPGFDRSNKPAIWRPYRLLFQQAKELKKHQFDMAVILRFDHWWGAWLAAAAGIPHRFGYNIPTVAPFLTDALPYNPNRHEVEQNWRLVHYAWSLGSLAIMDGWSDAEVMGSLEFFTSQADKDWVETWLKEHHILEATPFVVIHPGAGAAVKLWRAEAWAALATRLQETFKCQIVLSGGPTEVDLCQAIAAQMDAPPLSVAGQTSLSQLAALMGNATLVIGPDTGPLKLAAAVGTPTVELYGPVDVNKFGPWYDLTHQRYVTSGLACIACNHLDYTQADLPHHYCVRGLSVDWVWMEVNDLLKQVLPAISE